MGKPAGKPERKMLGNHWENQNEKKSCLEIKRRMGYFLWKEVKFLGP